MISAPSGAGKTTLVRELLKQDRRIVKSISMTTRPPRPGEKDGRDYCFVSEPVFRQLIRRRALVEWAKVHDHFYGTPQAGLDRARSEGKDAVLEIDVQGAMLIRRRHPEAVLIFVTAPSFQELRRRLLGRSSDSPQDIRKRLANARGELRYLPRYHYMILNLSLPQALGELEAIVQAERCRIKNRT